MDNYRYHCIVTNTNNGGVATSDAATLTVKAPHSHDISVSCGNSNPFTFTEWDGTGTFPGGDVCLSKDVILKNDITITGNVKLCLNGHTLSADSPTITIWVGETATGSEMPGTLLICDCGENGAIKGEVIIRENGMLNLYGGMIQNPMEGGYGIFNRGKLTVFGGKVVGETGIAGYQDETGETVIKGGEIVGTKLDGLYAGADVEIYGGTINGQDNGVFIGNAGRVAFANAPAITGGITVKRSLPDSADAAPIVTFIGEKSYTGANLEISLGNPAKTAGYLVQGNADSIGKFSLAEGALTDTTLEAKAEGNNLKLIDNPTYTVTYNGNGETSGTVPMDSSSYTSGAEVTVLGNTGYLKKDDHNFVGWNTQADGSGTDYAAGAGLTMGTADVTLYAQWAPIIDEYSANQTVNAGAWPTFSVTPRGEGPFTYQWQVSTDDGSTWTNMPGKTNDFLNFQATEAMNGYQYRCIVTNTASGCVAASPSATLTVNPAPITYTVTFDSKGGSVVESQTVSAGGKATAPAEPTKTGYTFAGWFKDEDLRSMQNGQRFLIPTTGANRHMRGARTIPFARRPAFVKPTARMSKPQMQL